MILIMTPFRIIEKNTIIKNQKLVFGSSNDLAKDSVKKLVEDLMKKVPYHSPDEFNTVPGKESGVMEKVWSSYSNLLSYDPKIAEVSIKDKIKKALKLEAAGLDLTSNEPYLFNNGQNYEITYVIDLDGDITDPNDSNDPGYQNGGVGYGYKDTTVNGNTVVEIDAQTDSDIIYS